MRVCAECRAVNPSLDAYCSRCGHELSTGAIETIDPVAVTAARLEAFASSRGEGVYEIARSGELLRMNAVAERVLGWREAELVGKNMHEAIHYQTRSGEHVSVDSCRLTGVVRSGMHFAEDDDFFVHRDGSLVSVAYVSSPVIVGGRVHGAVLAFWVRG
jgi:PAS domain S-box-containing protein